MAYTGFGVDPYQVNNLFNPVSMGNAVGQRGTPMTQPNWFQNLMGGTNIGQLAGFGIGAAGLIGAMGVDSPVPTDLSGAKQQYQNQITDVQGMMNETRNRQFGSDLPQVKYALEAIRKRFAQGQQQQSNQLTRSGVSREQNPLLFNRMQRTGNIEQARAEGSATAYLGSDFEQRKQQELMNLLGYMGQARQGYAGILGTEAQIKAQQDMMNKQAEGSFWGNLIGLGLGIAGL